MLCSTVRIFEVGVAVASISEKVGIKGKWAVMGVTIYETATNLD